MTRAVLALVALAGAAAARPAVAQAPASQQPALRIGFVNSRAILQQTPGYAAAESSFAKEVQGFREEIEKLRQQLDSAVRAFDQQSIALSATARQQKQRELQGMQDRVEQRASELQTRAQQRERELLQPIQTRVNSVIQGIRAEGNYAVIFDVEQAGIIAADPTLDLTQRVIQRLQQAQ